MNSIQTLLNQIRVNPLIRPELQQQATRLNDNIVVRDIIGDFFDSPEGRPSPWRK